MTPEPKHSALCYFENGWHCAELCPVRRLQVTLL